MHYCIHLLRALDHSLWFTINIFRVSWFRSVSVVLSNYYHKHVPYFSVFIIKRIYLPNWDKLYGPSVIIGIKIRNTSSSLCQPRAIIRESLLDPRLVGLLLNHLKRPRINMRTDSASDPVNFDRSFFLYRPLFYIIMALHIFEPINGHHYVPVSWIFPNICSGQTS